MEKEERDKLIEETKAQVIDTITSEVKTEVEQVTKLVNEIREAQKLMEEGKLTKSEFKEKEEKIEARIDQIETKLTRPPFENKEEQGEASPQMKAFGSYLKKGILEPEEKKVLTIADDTGVGYLAPAEFAGPIIQGITEISPMRSLASVVSTSQNSRQSPKETGVFDAGWVAEIGTRSETTGLTFGIEEIPVHEMYALVRISQQALEDSAFNLEAYLMEKFVNRFAVLEGKAFIDGNAVGKPEGFLTNSSVTKTTVVYDLSVDAILIAGMIDLIYNIKTAYSKVANLIMNRKSISYMRKMKDANNKYYWEPSFQAGTPGQFLGVPIVEVPDMPDPADGSYPVGYGDFKRGYLIVDRIGMAVQRLVEKYAEYGQVGFLARKRVGGQIVLAEAVQAGVGQA